eukprot:2551595-Alexandrium_andersonii.AAC.1
MQNRFRRSNLELRGPRSGLKNGPRSSRGVRSDPFCALNPNKPAGAGGAFSGGPGGRSPPGKARRDTTYPE